MITVMTSNKLISLYRFVDSQENFVPTEIDLTTTKWKLKLLALLDLLHMGWIEVS